MHFATGNMQDRAQAFVESIRPFLVTQDWDSLGRHLAGQWPPDRLADLLDAEHEEAVKASLIGLTLVGTMRQSPCVARLLRRTADPLCAAAAERALWTIWFRAGGPRHGPELIRAVHDLCGNRLKQAARRLERLVRRAPDYAEAWNQQGIAHFLLEQYERACADCVRTLTLNPDHFGAMAGLGHANAAMGCSARALEAYHRALQMNPWMTDLQCAIDEVRRSAAGAVSAVAGGRTTATT